jgi:hypothetical protein
MSMTAVFVQVSQDELAGIQADPLRVEILFANGSAAASLAIFGKLSQVMQERVKSMGPQMMANALSRLDPKTRTMLEARLGSTTEALAAGQGGADLLKLMQERQDRALKTAAAASRHRKLSLEKEWHGVHYLLCGKTEPDSELLSQAVLGGTILGDDDEGFSGYGPARFLKPEEVTALSRELDRPETESKAASRFSAAEMTRLGIYPGWRAESRDEVMDALRRLRDFYAEAAAKGSAIVTCLV